MPRITRITVSFSRQISDGNYGSETIRHEVEVVAQDDDEVLDSLTAAQALAACRGVVHTELARSPNWSIRRAVEDVSVLRPGEEPIWTPDEDQEEELPL
jgi:hypothetical protein